MKVNQTSAQPKEDSLANTEESFLSKGTKEVPAVLEETSIQVTKVVLRNRGKSPLFISLPQDKSIHLLPAESVEVDETVLELPQVKYFVDNRDIIITKIN